MDAETVKIESDERGFELHITAGDACCNWQAIAELLASTMRGHPGFVHRSDAERVALVAFDDLMARDDGRRVVNVQACAEELYDSVKANIGPWLAERDIARYEYETGKCHYCAGTGKVIQVTTDQSRNVTRELAECGDCGGTGHVKAGDPYADDGPWPGESVQSYYERTGQDGPLREVADALNKARKEGAA